ncbi:transcriptional regulator [Corynebacterium sp. Marseille-P4611]|uniref:transcriptional regulator n=1 Tax=Corynebacterium sp. Marseille-P4611 TaxID=2866575 RepID=UPI001CE3D4E0
MACLNSVDTANYQTLKAYMGVGYPALSKAVGALEEAGLVNVSRRILVVVETRLMFRLSLSVRPFSRLVFESPGFCGGGG